MLATDFAELPQGSSVRSESVKVSAPAPYVMVKFVIADGWDDFTTVQHIQFC